MASELCLDGIGRDSDVARDSDDDRGVEGPATGEYTGGSIQRDSYRKAVRAEREGRVWKSVRGTSVCGDW